MGFKKYTGLKNAAEIMGKIAEAALSANWVILSNNVPDYNIDGNGGLDGIRLAIKSPQGRVFASFRSANGAKIFTTQANDDNAYGIGLTCHSAYTQSPPSGIWYDQPEAPKPYGVDEVVGVGIPVNPNGSYNVYINIIDDPAEMLVVSIESGGLFQHLACGYLEKVGDWQGGLIFSGSRNSKTMFTKAKDFDPTDMETETLPLFAMAKESNTFLRMDIGGAPTRVPAVLWASSGEPAATSGYTGKQLALPVRKADILKADWPAKVPHYAFLQSQSTTDPGRNVNTLNCISVNEPQTVYVLVDPDELRNYSPVGYLPGMYFISMKNVAPAQIYEINYPLSGNLHQVFPYTKRRGIYGFDGFSVKQ